ncbi:TIGR04255 family protein [Sphingomonas mesophila]|uniref:TIGR04255 family protein n=1 Tax=Sphingomonas mesophila TaxID=2303576 RepID=UPI000E587897|nr:TIGR04255 family protein [Sphingomonas mesophila]
MNFPDAKRVVYQQNPSAEVICQLRFPPILALADRLPAEFQSRLGSEYPFSEVQDGLKIHVSGNDAPIQSRFSNFVFLTEDRSVRITLTSEYIALSTDSYERWESFDAHLNAALAALLSSYSVPFFSRIGLRYLDVISRAKLGIPDARWSDLIRASALGLLAEDDIPIADVLELNAATVLSLEDDAKGIFRTTLGKHEKTGDETVFVIDSDLFCDEVRIKGNDDAIAVCRRLNKISGRAFRWFLEDELHRRLDPKSP